MEELGAGFFLAMHDLEIRGAGEVLGESQSGQMQEVGFALYSEMLNKAVKSLKAGKVPDLAEPLAVTTEINLHAPALLPETYCPSIHERLVLYKRLAHCESVEDLEALQEELVDRFGLMPDATRVLIDSHRLRIEAKPLGIVKVDAGPGRNRPAVHQEPADRSRAHHPAHPDAQELQALRTGAAAHRGEARAAGAAGAAGAGHLQGAGRAGRVEGHRALAR